MIDAAAAHTSVLCSTVPAAGQLVEVRRHQWIDSDVDASAVSPELPTRNLVKLASIQERGQFEAVDVLVNTRFAGRRIP